MLKLLQHQGSQSRIDVCWRRALLMLIFLNVGLNEFWSSFHLVGLMLDAGLGISIWDTGQSLLNAGLTPSLQDSVPTLLNAGLSFSHHDAGLMLLNASHMFGLGDASIALSNSGLPLLRGDTGLGSFAFGGQKVALGSLTFDSQNAVLSVAAGFRCYTSLMLGKGLRCGMTLEFNVCTDHWCTHWSARSLEFLAELRCVGIRSLTSEC